MGIPFFHKGGSVAVRDMPTVLLMRCKGYRQAPDLDVSRSCGHVQTNLSSKCVCVCWWLQGHTWKPSSYPAGAQLCELCTGYSPGYWHLLTVFHLHQRSKTLVEPNLCHSHLRVSLSGFAHIFICLTKCSSRGLRRKFLKLETRVHGRGGYLAEETATIPLLITVSLLSTNAKQEFWGMTSDGL